MSDNLENPWIRNTPDAPWNQSYEDPEWLQSFKETYENIVCDTEGYGPDDERAARKTLEDDIYILWGGLEELGGSVKVYAVMRCDWGIDEGIPVSLHRFKTYAERQASLMNEEAERRGLNQYQWHVKEMEVQR